MGCWWMSSAGHRVLQITAICASDRSAGSVTSVSEGTNVEQPIVTIERMTRGGLEFGEIVVGKPRQLQRPPDSV